MAVLTHGSDLSLAPALEGFVRAGNVPIRTALDRIHSQGFSAVQLDAALPGLRPRELDTRARRDLQAVLTRLSLRPAGVELFIPQRHFVEPEHQDRAMAATLDALTFAADLGRLPVSVALPVESLGDELRKSLVEAADVRGVRLAVHAEDQLDKLIEWVEQVDLPALGVAIDPASLLALRHDPVATVHRLGGRVAVARLSDWAAQQRCVVGRGELDVVQYRIALDLAAKSRVGPVVLDLRGLAEPLAGATQAVQVWEKSAFKL